MRKGVGVIASSTGKSLASLIAVDLIQSAKKVVVEPIAEIKPYKGGGTSGKYPYTRKS